MSPDMTHLVEVDAGDLLPALTYAVYGDSSYFAQVAKFNGINKFAALKRGTLLGFPAPSKLRRPRTPGPYPKNRPVSAKSR